MAEQQENIEARLCAYVEDELDAAGRIEIEKHLEANPQHRQLLIELTRARDMLRALPRESAPPEIAETVNGQLERSVLLGGAGDEVKIAGRVNRFPQLAAILVLGLGLAAVVFFTLPRAPRPPVALSTPASTDSIASLAPTTGPATAPALAKDAGVSPAEPSPTVALAKPGSSDPEALKEHSVDRMKGETSSVERGRANNNAKPLLVVVTSLDPSAASQQVAEFLTRNGIPYEAPAEPLELSNLQTFKANAAEPDHRMTNERAAKSATDSLDTAQLPRPRESGSKADIDGQPATTAPSFADLQQSEQGSRGDKPPIAPGAPSTRSLAAAGSDAEKPPVSKGEADQAQSAHPQATPAFNAQQQRLATNTAELRGKYILARNMTRRQTAELTNQLASPKASQRASVYDRYAMVDNSGAQRLNALNDKVPFTAGPTTRSVPPNLEAPDPLLPKTAEPTKADGVNQRAPQMDAAPTPSEEVASNADRMNKKDVDDQKSKTGDSMSGVFAAQAKTEEQKPASTQPAYPVVVIRANDKLSVTFEAPSGEAKQTTAQVDEGGKIRLPSMDPIACAGLTTAELEAALSKRYREQNKSANPRVTVKRLENDRGGSAGGGNESPPNAQMPVREANTAAQVSTNKPATTQSSGAEQSEIAFKQQTTPQPAQRPNDTSVALAADDEPTDVVILVQNEEAVGAGAGVGGAAATPAPATQPMSMPPEPAMSAKTAATGPTTRDADAVERAAPDAPNLAK